MTPATTFLLLSLITLKINKRFVDHSQRVVNPVKPSGNHVTINEPARNGNARDAAEALLGAPSSDSGSGGKGKPKQKAYRRSDSSGGRSRSTTKELALPPDDSLMCPPSFLTGLKPDLEVVDGTKMELKVSVKGDPLPQVTWTKDGKPLTSNDIMEVKYKNGVASLTVEEIYPEDAGRYACKATNAKGAVETSSRVKVTPKKAAGGGGASSNGGAASAGRQPRVYKHLDSHTVTDGDPVKLECTIACDATFDVVWLHNEKEIKPSKDFQYLAKGNTYTLEIAEIFPEDSGTYTCEAFNDAGECFSTATLNVVVPGEEPHPINFKSFPKSLTVTRGETATFVASLETGGLSAADTKVTWMKDGKVVSADPAGLKLKLTENLKSGLISLEVKECNATGDAGQWAVIAANSKGQAKAAFSLNVH